MGYLENYVQHVPKEEQEKSAIAYFAALDCVHAEYLYQLIGPLMHKNGLKIRQSDIPKVN